MIPEDMGISRNDDDRSPTLLSLMRGDLTATHSAIRRDWRGVDPFDLALLAQHRVPALAREWVTGEIVAPTSPPGNGHLRPGSRRSGPGMPGDLPFHGRDGGI